MKGEEDGSARRFHGPVSRPDPPQRCRFAGVAGETPARGGAGAGAADHRSAPSFLGCTASRPLFPAGAAGGYRRRPQHRRDRVPRMPGDVSQGRPAGDGTGRRGRIRQRHRGDECVRQLRSVPRRRGDHRPCRPHAGGAGARRAGGADWRSAAADSAASAMAYRADARSGDRQISRRASVPPHAGARRDVPRGLRATCQAGTQLRILAVPSATSGRDRSGARVSRHDDHPEPCRGRAGRRPVFRAARRKSSQAGARTLSNWRSARM